MGLLDDAIREHLDLKRRRGADPSEIAKEEADALGPVRRDGGEEPAAAASYADAGALDHEPAGLDEPAVAYDDEPFASPDPDPVPATSFYDDRALPAEEPRTHEHAYAEPEQESALPPHGDPFEHQQTREFSATELDEALARDEPLVAPDPPAPAPAPTPAAADPAPAGDDADEDEDVLEETPDFLQETPEHDRLWFEQKPPKDFDF